MSRKSISRAVIIEVGVMGGISFEEIRWQYPAVFHELFRGAVGPTIYHSSLVFTANGSWSSPETTFLVFRAPAQSYPIRSPTEKFSLSRISFAILSRWSYVAPVLLVGMLFFSRGMYSRVYAGVRFISSCEKYPLTFRPDTCRELTIKVLLVIVDNFNLTGSESAFIFLQTSWLTNVLLLWISNKAFTNISGLPPFTQDSHSGIIIDVWFCCCLLSCSTKQWKPSFPFGCFSSFWS